MRRLNAALGLTWFRGKLFVSHVVPYSVSAGAYTGRVTAYSRFNGRRFKRKRTVLRGIPTGQHRLGSIVPGVSLEQGYRFADKIHNSGQAIVWAGAKEPAELYWEQLNDAGLTMAPLEQG